MGRRGSLDTGVQNNVRDKGHTSKDTYIGNSRRQAGGSEQFREHNAWKPKKAHPSRGEARRQLSAKKYPYGNGIAILSIVTLGLFVCASVYWIVVGLMPPTA